MTKAKEKVQEIAKDGDMLEKPEKLVCNNCGKEIQFGIESLKITSNKIKIDFNGITKEGKIVINGEDISDVVNKIDIKVEAGKIPQFKLRGYFD